MWKSRKNNVGRIQFSPDDDILRFSSCTPVTVTDRKEKMVRRKHASHIRYEAHIFCLVTVDGLKCVIFN
jgi:hypothetical protein